MTAARRSTPRLLPRLAVLAFGLFLVGSNSSIIAGVMPDLAAEFEVAAADVGWAITAYALAVAAAAPVLAIAFAQRSRTALMAVGLATIAAGTLLAALAPDLTTFIVARGIAGLGGAALIPTVTSSATALAPSSRRGHAIAIVSIGFTVANAVGAPIGTLIASVSDWRVPMAGIAALAVLALIPLIALVRNVPITGVATIRARLAVLRSTPRLAILASTFLMFTGLNLLFNFAAEVTGYTGWQLAALLLAFGLGGIVGNVVAGPVTDGWGPGAIGLAVFAAQVAVSIGLAALPRSFSLVAVLFGLWGVMLFAATIPLQHRIVAIDPSTAGIALSWYGTATYLGVAATAPAAAWIETTGGDYALLVPVLAAVLSSVAGLCFALSGPRARDRSGGPRTGPPGGVAGSHAHERETPP